MNFAFVGQSQELASASRRSVAPVATNLAPYDRLAFSILPSRCLTQNARSCRAFLQAQFASDENFRKINENLHLDCRMTRFVNAHSLIRKPSFKFFVNRPIRQ